MERRFPGIGERLGRFPLIDGPTPVHRLDQFSARTGLGPLWIKRDDRSCALYGGNKPRKLEFLLGAALRRGRRSVMTFGGIGTHHGLATTICARAAGLRSILVLIPQPVTEHVRRCLLLNHAYGAELHAVSSVAGAARRALALYARGLVQGDWPAMIPTGGTSARGTIGYVNAALELADQIAAGALPEPDWVFTPLGSGGTVAGLTAGFRLAKLRTRVAGVLVTDILPPSAARLASLANAAVRRMRAVHDAVPEIQISPQEIHVVRGYVGKGYGAPTHEALVASELIEKTESIHLETTYTAKCLAAVIDLAARPPYREGTILFWNTYTSIDPSARAGRLPEYRELPRSFHKYFEDELAV